MPQHALGDANPIPQLPQHYAVRDGVLPRKLFARPSRCPGPFCSDGVLHEVVEDSEVSVPPIQDWRRLAEPQRFGWGMTS